MPKYLTLTILAVALLFGCTIDDEDRCPSGYYWDGKIMACRVVEEDAGAVDAGDDGYLAQCRSQEECDVFESDLYCLYDPTKDEPGICVVQGCETAATCPDDTLCCDCTVFPVTVCLAEVVVDGTALEAACECTP